MLAHCGTKKVWHWAHKGRRHCDHWWENETEWHRNWKDYFPKEWQEIPSRDPNGELHIADVKTSNGLVIEFQHSKIDLEEALKRTLFHAPIIWVVDGLRRKTDLKQFDRALGYPTYNNKQLEIGRVSSYDCRLVDEWCELGAVIAFDFGRPDLWLMSGKDWACEKGFWYSKKKLIENIINGKKIPHISNVQKNNKGKIIDKTNTVPHSLHNDITSIEST